MDDAGRPKRQRRNKRLGRVDEMPEEQARAAADEFLATMTPVLASTMSLKDFVDSHSGRNTSTSSKKRVSATTSIC